MRSRLCRGRPHPTGPAEFCLVRQWPNYLIAIRPETLHLSCGKISQISVWPPCPTLSNAELVSPCSPPSDSACLNVCRLCLRKSHSLTFETSHRHFLFCMLVEHFWSLVFCCEEKEEIFCLQKEFLSK